MLAVQSVSPSSQLKQADGSCCCPGFAVANHLDTGIPDGGQCRRCAENSVHRVVSETILGVCVGETFGKVAEYQSIQTMA